MPIPPLVTDAFDLADRLGRTVYDCVYLALAVRLGGQMVTADERFANSLAATAWAASAIRLQDIP
jgi:predicted nucleic acid-binding protein